MTAHPVSDDLLAVAARAQSLRRLVLMMTTAAQSGHLSSCLSGVDLLAVLSARYATCRWDRPGDPANDRFIFSKGHASALFYALLCHEGVISEADCIDTYRTFGSPLQGHLTTSTPWHDFATGSLGLGPAYAMGLGLGLRLASSDARIWVICGDGELAEGSFWEGMEHLAEHQLSKVTVLIDVNGLGQTGSMPGAGDLGRLAGRVAAFGCLPHIVLDGHDICQIDDALRTAIASSQPSVVIARTVKGKGVPEIENSPHWHGRALAIDQAAKFLSDADIASIRRSPRAPRFVSKRPAPTSKTSESATLLARHDLNVFERDKAYSSRDGYGECLAALAKTRDDLVVLDADMWDSTRSGLARGVRPDHFFDMHIAEQQLVAAAAGLSVTGFRPFVSTFGAFFARAFDQIRMSAIARHSIRFCGSHGGVEVGEHGPSQMALEDFAMFSSLPGSVVFCASDARCAANLTAVMYDLEGLSYLRTSRGTYPVLYAATTEFNVGGMLIPKLARNPDACIIACGVAVHAALDAAKVLADAGISVTVADAYCLKPLNTDLLRELVEQAGRRLVVVEDHYADGGLGSAVARGLLGCLSGVQWRHLAVPSTPGSGSPAQQLAWAGIDSRAIADAVREMIEGREVGNQ